MFGTVGKKAYRAYPARGACFTLNCNMQEKCPFKIIVEQCKDNAHDECVDKWFVADVGVEAGHNHPLTQTLSDRMVTASTRVIPPKLRQLGLVAHRSGLSHADVYALLEEECVESNEPVTFTAKD